MPLFIYKCNKCEHLMEKFMHSASEENEIFCEECNEDGNICEKQLSFGNNRVRLDARTMLKDKIEPDAKRIMDKMEKGSNDDFFDVYGDN